MKKFIFTALMLSLSLSAQADEGGLCDKISAIKKNNQQQIERFALTQFGFASKPELAIIVHNVNLPAQIRQVTFGRGQVQPACYFKPLAFEQGGDWGWHTLWSEPVGLFYARMDGEAWVSSNPKSLTKFTAINPQFKLQQNTITVTWQQLENGVTVNMQAISSDEGRNWDIAVMK